MSAQLEEWAGAFGDAYTARNVVDWRDRLEALVPMLDGLKIKTALEVGCNRGHNLHALKAVGIEAYGTEPNAHARELARATGLNVNAESIYVLSGSYDLVLCCAVLIHVPRDRLYQAMSELARAADRYVLSIEYAADADTEVEYRGMPSMLWKRPYGNLWEMFGTVIRSGEAWGGTRYWLVKVPDAD